MVGLASGSRCKSGRRGDGEPRAPSFCTIILLTVQSLYELVLTTFLIGTVRTKSSRRIIKKTFGNELNLEQCRLYRMVLSKSESRGGYGLPPASLFSSCRCAVAVEYSFSRIRNSRRSHGERQKAIQAIQYASLTSGVPLAPLATPTSINLLPCSPTEPLALWQTCTRPS